MTLITLSNLGPSRRRVLLHVCDAGARAVERRWGGGLIGETIVVGVEVGQGQPLEATLTKLADMSLGFVHVVRAKISAC